MDGCVDGESDEWMDRCEAIRFGSRAEVSQMDSSTGLNTGRKQSMAGTSGALIHQSERRQRHKTQSAAHSSDSK